MPTANPIARLTSMSICASAHSTVPVTAEANLLFAASNCFETSAESMSSNFTASGHTISCVPKDNYRKQA